MDKPAALALIGPTASGKTAAALQLAQKIPLEIISMDSALVYRGMDIGTAKPDAGEQAAVPHHLIDIRTPCESYSAAEFVDDCVRLVREIRARGRLPVIVGGTMMYYHALSSGLNELPPANETIRSQLRAEKERDGLAALYAQLQQCDPITAARLQANDSQRIERALEIFRISGTPMSVLLENHTQHTPLQLHTLALLPEPRAQLHQTIARRFMRMLEQGFVEEVRHLQRLYPELDPELPSMRAVGYRQAWDFLAEKTDHTTFIAQGIAATRQLAKRQITWLRRFAIADSVNPYDAEANITERLYAMAQRI
ncbi:MAG: tRNA (adenosine(37)-N6)-dimethylallyltransferase MiaA [Neisseria sp.]|nr:tRNA (adenosine(37)-N6)-dimethylallyltransferase MiaA [Neisseria sp.]